MIRLRNLILIACISGILVGCNATAQGGGLDGLYFMTRFWMGSGLETATYLFHNGNVVKNPVGGSRTLDLAAEKAAHPNDVGTFKLAGGQLSMTFPSGTHTAKYEAEKGGFGWDAGIFSPVEMFKTGTTFDGTFEGGHSVGSLSGSSAGSGVLTSSEITFHRDGTYEGGTVTSFASRSSESTVSGGGQNAQAGRYRIEGTAMHMIPNGGKEVVLTTFPWDDGTTGPMPRSVYLGGTMMKRVK